MLVTLESNGGLLTLGDSLATGGEGTIYPVGKGTRYAAKIYHAPSPERAEKLLAMLAAVPACDETADGAVALAWPLGRLLDGEGRCIGFLMRSAKDKQRIFEVYNPSVRPAWVDQLFLLKAARELARIVEAVHSAGHLIGDLNESNVLVGQDARVTLVDTDSFQIVTAKHVYSSGVGRPEFTPPEMQGVPFSEVERMIEHDHFALAVLIFLLLMEGTHPFAARYTGPGESPSLTAKIGGGLWPYTRNQRPLYDPLRRELFEAQHSGVQALFRRAFEEGHKNPTQRPTAAEWDQALGQAVAGHSRAQVVASISGWIDSVAALTAVRLTLQKVSRAIWQLLNQTVPRSRQKWLQVMAAGILALLLQVVFAVGRFPSHPAGGGGEPPSDSAKTENSSRFWEEVRKVNTAGKAKGGQGSLPVREAEDWQTPSKRSRTDNVPGFWEEIRKVNKLKRRATQAAHSEGVP